MALLSFPLGVTNAVQITSQNLMVLAARAAAFSVAGEPRDLANILGLICNEGVPGPQALLGLRQLAAGFGIAHPEQTNVARLERTLQSVSTPYFYWLFDACPPPSQDRVVRMNAAVIWRNELTLAEEDDLKAVVLRNLDSARFDYGAFCARLSEYPAWKETYSLYIGRVDSKIGQLLARCLFENKYTESVRILTELFEPVFHDLIRYGKTDEKDGSGQKWFRGLVEYLADPKNANHLIALAGYLKGNGSAAQTKVHWRFIQLKMRLGYVRVVWDRHQKTIACRKRDLKQILGHLEVILEALQGIWNDQHRHKHSLGKEWQSLQLAMKHAARLLTMESLEDYYRYLDLSKLEDSLDALIKGTGI